MTPGGKSSEQQLARVPYFTLPLQHLFERILSDTQEEHNGKVRIGVITFTNLRTA